MTIRELIEKADLINIKGLCKRTGLDYQRITNKIRNNRELSVIEAHLIDNVLKTIYKVEVI